MARPFRIGATGVWVVGATRTIHPNSETGRAVFQCAAGRSRSTTSCNVTGLQVRPNPPALPKLFRTSSQAVDPQRSINEVGHAVSGCELGRTPASFPGSSNIDFAFHQLVKLAVRSAKVQVSLALVFGNRADLDASFTQAGCGRLEIIHKETD